MIMKTINRPYNEQDVYDYLLETYENSTSWTSMALKDKSILFINNKPTEFLINQVKTYYEFGYSYNDLMWFICDYYWLNKYWNVDIIGLNFLPLKRVNNENKTDEEDEFIDDSEYDNGPLVMHTEDIPRYPSRLSKGNGGHTKWYYSVRG